MLSCTLLATEKVRKDSDGFPLLSKQWHSLVLDKLRHPRAVAHRDREIGQYVSIVACIARFILLELG